MIQGGILDLLWPRWWIRNPCPYSVKPGHPILQTRWPSRWWIRNRCLRSVNPEHPILQTHWPSRWWIWNRCLRNRCLHLVKPGHPIPQTRWPSRWWIQNCFPHSVKPGHPIHQTHGPSSSWRVGIGRGLLEEIVSYWKFSFKAVYLLPEWLVSHEPPSFAQLSHSPKLLSLLVASWSVNWMRVARKNSELMLFKAAYLTYFPNFGEIYIRRLLSRGRYGRLEEMVRYWAIFDEQ